MKGVKQFLEVKLHEIRKYYPDWEYIGMGIDYDQRWTPLVGQCDS